MSKPSDNHQFDPQAFIVVPGQDFKLADRKTRSSEGLKDKKAGKEALAEDVSRLADAQELLWANGSRAVLIIFQALDAAGKDGSIKHVMSGVNPQGVDVIPFKAPNDAELKHHFLWRPMQKLPARGRIAIFNRSYYEEVLVVRVHPEFLDKQALPSRLEGKPLDDLWESRFEEINAFERHLVDNDITVIKFFLHLSKDEQRERFLDRLNEPGKLWKFSAADLAERGHWDNYTTQSVQEIGDEITEVHLVPAGRPLRSQPGQFVYVSFDADAVSKETHPFSISSPPESSQLRLSIKRLGDWTADVSAIKAGKSARVSGPFGRFGRVLLEEPLLPAVMLAGGIGITPFLSIMASEAFTGRMGKSMLIYSTNDRAAAVYRDELRERAKELPMLTLVEHYSDEAGYIDRAYLEGLLDRPLPEYLFMICGPTPMMNGLRDFLANAGVRKKQILTEDFEIR